MNNDRREAFQVIELLAQAGIEAEIVSKCTDGACVVCTGDLAAAA